MKIMRIIGRVLLPACLIYTVLTFIWTGIMSASGDTTYILSIQALASFLVFSLLMSGLNQILYIKSWSFGLRIFLHYIGFIVSFLVIFLLVLNKNANTTGALLIVLALSVVYFIIAGIAAVIRHLHKKEANKTEKYESVFSGRSAK